MNAESTGRPLKGFLRLPQVLELIPVSRSRWYLGVKTGEFPSPVRLSANISAWRASDIEMLIEQLSAGGRQT